MKTDPFVKFTGSLAALFLAVGLSASLGLAQDVIEFPENEPPRKSTKKKSEEKAPEWVEKLAQTYGSAKTLKAKIEKAMISPFLGPPKLYRGDLVIKGRNMRLELKSSDGDDHTLSLLEGEQITHVTFPPKADKTAKVQVLTSIMDQQAETYRLINAVLKGQGLSDRFRLEKVEKKKKVSVYFLRPTKKDSRFSRLSITMNNKDSLIEEFSYWDDLDTEVRYRLSRVKLNSSVRDRMFRYQAPKDAIRTSI